MGFFWLVGLGLFIVGFLGGGFICLFHLHNKVEDFHKLPDKLCSDLVQFFLVVIYPLSLL